MAIRLLLLDADAMFRSGVRRLLAGDEVEVVGEAGTADAAMAAACDPDVILLDANLDPPVEAIPRLDAAAPRAAVVAVVAGPNGDAAVDAVRSGAAGLLLREGPLEDIREAVAAVAAGDGFVPRPLAAPLLRRVRAMALERPAASAAGLDGLSTRQRQVLQLVARGYDNGEIAARLGISAATARNHVSQILLKLEVDNRIQAAVAAVRHGLA